MLVVLAEDHAGDLRVVPRREEDEPAMVAQVAAAAPRGQASLVRNHLRGAGLARDVASEDAAAAAGAGAVDDAPQPVVQRRQRRRLERHAFGDDGRRRHLPAAAFVDRADDVRRHARPAVGHRGNHHRQRRRRHRHLALADRDRNRLTRVPAFTGALALPLGRRHEAFLLVRQVDPRQPRQSELLGPLVNPVDAEHVAERVEVDVARLLERRAHVDRAVAALQVAEEIAAEERGAAAAVHPEVGIDDPLFERRRRDDDLERRSGRVAPLDRRGSAAAAARRC